MLFVIFRRNWKRRWFVLKDNVLTYHESDLEGAKSLGTIDIRNAVYVDIFLGRDTLCDKSPRQVAATNRFV